MKKRTLIVLAALVAFLGFPAIGLAFSEVLDTTEEQAMAETLQFALEYNSNGRESYWSNPDTGRSGSVVPFNRFVDTGGLTCREYVSTLYIDGEEERDYGTACRNADGRWMVVLDSDGTHYAGAPAARSYVYVYRDPARYYYPWVYYAPAYYPYRIFFSFVFSSHSRHFHRAHFHSGYLYQPRRSVIYKPKPGHVIHHRRPEATAPQRPPFRKSIEQRAPRPAPVVRKTPEYRHESGPTTTTRQVEKRDHHKSRPERTVYRQGKQRDIRGNREAKPDFQKPHHRKDQPRMMAEQKRQEDRRSTPPPKLQMEQKVEQGRNFSSRDGRHRARYEQQPPRNPWQQRKY
ncbi:MAG: hypothetical protein JXK94_08900 [Deltaproteobacteria bacterium]|nr:hypothetical protein [Deltaproteobacteria bacterium]